MANLLDAGKNTLLDTSGDPLTDATATPGAPASTATTPPSWFTDNTVTTVSFQPSATASPPLSFTFQTEGATYNGQCTWNLARQDWYLQIFDAGQNLIISHPLISSPAATPQNLVPGVFAATVVYYIASLALIYIVEITPPPPVVISPLPFLALSE